jgi:hypothetical protein
MDDPIYVLIGVVTFVVSLIAVVRTRAVLRFRSSGRIEPGSIADWEVWAWRLMAGVMMVLSAAFVYVTVFEL